MKKLIFWCLIQEVGIDRAAWAGGEADGEVADWSDTTGSKITLFFFTKRIVLFGYH